MSLGIPESAAAAAEASGIVAFWPQVRFAHPLARSAVYHAATAVQRRQAHQALAAAADAAADVDAQAWHLAAAAVGPDEPAATAQQAAAEKARRRGGHAAAAALLERAALLTPDPQRREERRLSAAQAHWMAGSVDRAQALLEEAVGGLRDPLSQAQAMRLQGRIEFTRGQVAAAASALVAAAQRLLLHDPRASRDTLLSALEASVYAGWASEANTPLEIARTARGLTLPGEPSDSGPNLLLHGYTTRVTEGYPAAVPGLRRAVQVFLTDNVDPDVALQRLALAALAAADLLDDTSVERLTTRWIDRARESGALARLAAALAFRSALVDAPAGRLPAARAEISEASELAQVTHNPGVVPPAGTHTLPLLVLSGREQEARDTAAAVAREAPSRGAAGEAAFAAACLGVLELSRGNYAAAVECLRPAWADDTPLVGTRALPDLVEAAVRAGLRPLAEAALSRLSDRTTASGTPLALGLLSRSRALLADAADAGQSYQDAADALGATGVAPELARTHLLHGEWLRRQRRRREARDQLRVAHDMFDAMGLDAFSERASVELRATGERAHRREPGHPEQLTAQEARIATLVSEGGANRDIATQLFISPSTVEYHLHKVYRKLGVSSRTQLARHVLEAGDAAFSGTDSRPGVRAQAPTS